MNVAAAESPEAWPVAVCATAVSLALTCEAIATLLPGTTGRGLALLGVSARARWWIGEDRRRNLGDWPVRQHLDGMPRCSARRDRFEAAPDRVGRG